MASPSFFPSNNNKNASPASNASQTFLPTPKLNNVVRLPIIDPAQKSAVSNTVTKQEEIDKQRYETSVAALSARLEQAATSGLFAIPKPALTPTISVVPTLKVD